MNDHLELELAFNAFARVVIDRLLSIAPGEGIAIERALLDQARRLHADDHGSAALALEILAKFSVQREVQQALLASETTLPPQ